MKPRRASAALVKALVAGAGLLLAALLPLAAGSSGSAAGVQLLDAVRATVGTREERPPATSRQGSATRQGGSVDATARAAAPDPQAAQLAARLTALQKSVEAVVAGQQTDQASQREIADRVETLTQLLETRLERMEARVEVSTPQAVDGGQFEATAALTVPEAALRNFILANGSSARAVVMWISDRVDGARQDDRLVEALVAEHLIEHGIRVFSSGGEGDAPAAIGADALEQAGIDAAEYLAQWVADLRVVTEFSQDNQGIISYTSRATLRLINVRTGEIGEASSTDTMRGFALNRPQAAERARRAVAAEIGPLLYTPLRRTPPVRIAVLVPAADAELLPKIREAVAARPEFRLVSEEERAGVTHVVLESHVGIAGLVAYLRRRVPEIVFDASVS